MLNTRARGSDAGRGYGRLLDLLAVVASAREPLTGSDIGRRLGIPKSTASVLLQYLSARGILACDAKDRRYSVGAELVALAYDIVGGRELTRVARPHLEWLAHETGDDVYLGVRRAARLVYVDKVEGNASVQLNLRLGTLRPLHCTAAGKVLLAFGPPGLLEELDTESGLREGTAAAITDVRRLASELARVRARGYAVSDAEHIEGIYAVAAPVRDRTGMVIAAVSLATHRARGRERHAALAVAVGRTAAAVGEALGAPAGTGRRSARAPGSGAREERVGT